MRLFLGSLFAAAVAMTGLVMFSRAPDNPQGLRPTWANPAAKPRYADVQGRDRFFPARSDRIPVPEGISEEDAQRWYRSGRIKEVAGQRYFLPRAWDVFARVDGVGTATEPDPRDRGVMGSISFNYPSMVGYVHYGVEVGGVSAHSFGLLIQPIRTFPFQNDNYFAATRDEAVRAFINRTRPQAITVNPEGDELVATNGPEAPIPGTTALRQDLRRLHHFMGQYVEEVCFGGELSGYERQHGRRCRLAWIDARLGVEIRTSYYTGLTTWQDRVSLAYRTLEWMRIS